ncbi:hypothetical protein HK405_000657, partial [Cladochytrium tenue]
WSVPGIDTVASVPFEIPDGETIDAVVAILSEGAIGSSKPHAPAPPGVTNAVKEDQDDDIDLDPSVVDRCLKFLRIPSPYDVLHSLSVHTTEQELPALDRMMAVVERQDTALNRVLEWHKQRASILRRVAAGDGFKLPKVLENELTEHFRLKGLELELRRKLSDDDSLTEFPRFAPQACRASDVEFRDPQAVGLMKSLERLGLLDRMYFRRFDMKTEEIHLNSCYIGRGRGDIYLETIEPASGKAVSDRKKAVITGNPASGKAGWNWKKVLIIVGDVDTLIPPPKDTRVFRSKDLERVPPEVLQAKLHVSIPFIDAAEWFEL